MGERGRRKVGPGERRKDETPNLGLSMLSETSNLKHSVKPQEN